MNMQPKGEHADATQLPRNIAPADKYPVAFHAAAQLLLLYDAAKR
jgi:hypothetical protein